MIPMTLPDLKELISGSQSQRQELRNLYSRLPETSCRRRARCCSLLPDLSLVEALEALDQVRNFPPSRRQALTQKIVRYFFINPAEITACPFLDDRDCLIYPSRFFGCRAYGLWSAGHYRQIADQARSAKKNVVRLWKNLGVPLPEAVTGHRLAYCAAVETIGERSVSDEDLLQAADRVERCSRALNPRHLHFQEGYFRDLSFLTASVFVGFSQAVPLKFSLVRDLLRSGDQAPLQRVIDGVPDIFDF